MMRQARTMVFDMAHPEDVSGLADALARGRIDPSGIKAVFVKTEGNGLDNDWSRPLAARALERCLGTGAMARIMVVASGGCEGLLTPHMTVLVCDEDDGAPADGGGALAIGCACSPALAAAELGRETHARRTQETLLAACADAGLALDEVVHAHVLSPWMGHELLAAAPAGADLVARGAHASKPAIRSAAAVGAGMALGEIGAADVRWTPGGPACARHARRVAVTAGDTAGQIKVMVLGHGREWRGRARAACVQLRDMLDIESIAAARGGVLLAAFFKGDPPADGRVRGARTTMGSDSDIHAFRHYRAAMSGVFGAALGTPRVFIGGGAECQCAAGGGVLTTLYETDGI